MKNAVAAILMALGAIAAVLWAAQWGFKNPVFDTNQSAGSGQSVDSSSGTATDQSATNQPDAVQSPDDQQVAVLETGLENLATISFSSLQRTTTQNAQAQSASGTGSVNDATDAAAVQRRRAPVRASW